MPKPSFSRSNRQEVAGVWAGDGLGPDTIMPHGSMIDVTQFTANTPEGRIHIFSGTLVGRTYTERDAGTGFGLADVVNDDEIFLITRDVWNASEDNHVDFYRHHKLVHDNWLPEFLHDGVTPFADSAEHDWIRAHYQCWHGQD